MGAEAAPTEDVSMSEAEPRDVALLRAPTKAKRDTEALHVTEAERRRWKGATVQSLNLLPVAVVAPTASVRTALEASRAHRGQCVMIAENGWLRGYVDLTDLVAHESVGSLNDEVVLVRRPLAGTTRAPRYPRTYRVVDSDTPLADVAKFLAKAPFALVTSADGASLDRVVTQGDLARYAEMANLDAKASPLGSRASEESQRDRSLADVLRLLDGYAPLIPDEVSDYYLERAGFQCGDVRLYVWRLTQQTSAGAGYGKVCGRHCVRRVPVRADPDECGPRPRLASWRSSAGA